VTVIDVRRHDERALYGSIRGSAHLPAEHVPRALLMPPEDFLRAFHFRKPDPDATVVLYSRKSERATYAKQLFADAGMRRCLVLSEGVMGWGKGGGEDARAYDAFAEGEPPPEPRETKTPAPVDRAAAEAELLHKNVLL
jgi:rhodanese-related sulfurtransferase